MSDYINGKNLTDSTSFELPTIVIKKSDMEHLIKDTKKRTAQRYKAELLADLAVLVAIIFIGAGLAFAVADAVFGQEAVTNWLAALVM